MLIFFFSDQGVFFFQKTGDFSKSERDLAIQLVLIILSTEE